MKRMTLLPVFSVIIPLFFLACGGPQEKSTREGSKMVMKLATMTPLSHTYNQGALRFAELIRDRTGGRIEIVVYPDGQLGKGERELLEAVQQGTIDIYVGSTGPLGGFSSSISILDIPFLFRDHAHVDKVLDGPIGKRLLNDLENAGFKALAFWENGFRHLTNSKRPVKTPTDVRGLKIRTMENKIHIAAWKAIGANPVPMPWGEVYTALQQRTIDGQENPIAVIHSSKLNEVQKFLTLTQHVYSPAILIASSKRWQEMRPEDRDIFAKTAMEVATYQRKLGRDNEAKQTEELRQKGMHIVAEIDKSQWRNAMASALAEYEKQFGKENIQAIVNIR